MKPGIQDDYHDAQEQKQIIREQSTDAGKPFTDFRARNRWSPARQH
jgi:hypothetical protein